MDAANNDITEHVHFMEKIGDDSYTCRDCGHIEIGCAHSRTETKNSIIICSICTMINPIQPEMKPKEKNS